MERLSKRRIWIYLSIMGPGFIAAQAGNDAGGIATYSLAGSRYGYTLLWSLVLATFSLIIVQEMATRMGVVTGKGLAALIRENFGLKLTIFCMVSLLFANLATAVSEFAGMAAAFEIFGVSRFIVVPALVVFVWLLVVRGSYKSVEKLFIGIACLYISYIIVGIIAKPEWTSVLHGAVTTRLGADSESIVLLIALIGTTIAPWMQFFIQSTVVDKGVRIEDYAYQRFDVITGALFSNTVSFFIIVSTAATLFLNHRVVETAADAAQALVPLAGQYAGAVFALGLIGASILAACIIPLTTAYAICEAFGWEAGIDRKLREAPIFIGIYSFTIVFGAIVVLLPGISLLRLMMFSQTVNGILLPILLVYMVLMVNDKTLMGKYTNGPIYNIVAWGTVMSLVALTSALLWFSVFA